MRRFLESIENTRYLNGPTKTHENNIAAITQIRKDRSTPQIKDLDLKMRWLHQNFVRDTFAPLYIDTKINCVDTDYKSTDGIRLQSKILQVIGFKHYPQKNNVHYKLVQLHEYDIGRNFYFQIWSYQRRKVKEKGNIFIFILYL